MSSTIHAAAARRAAGSLLALSCAASLLHPRGAAAQTFDITGVWRDENANSDDKNTPLKEDLPATVFHGTYRSRPYLLIRPQDPNKPEGPFFIYSDVGDLRAELRPVAGAPNDLTVVDRRSGATLGLLRIDGDACDGRPACFAFVNPSNDLPVPATYAGLAALYVPVGAYDKGANPVLPQKYSDNFSPVSDNFSYILKCWHLATMSTTDYQDPGCQNNIFAIPQDDPYGYAKVAMGSGPNNAVPFAWTYKSTLFQQGEDRGRTWETGQDVTEADSLKVGVKATVNVMGVEASSHVSVGVQSKVQEMYDSKLTYSKAEYLITKFAFVLHRYYAHLDPRFSDRVALLKAAPAAQRADEYRRFVLDFGTHYANAITFGSKGERVLRMTQSQVQKMNESQTDVSVGLTAGYMGNSVGVDVDTSKNNMQKITANTSSEDRSWFCYSGGTCNDGIPSGEGALPVQLDLRPISDLLAPPFFTDDEILTTIRDAISREVGAQGFVTRDDLALPSAAFATLTAFTRANLTAFSNDVSQMMVTSQPCGVSRPCNDGTLTLTAPDGSIVLIPSTFSPQLTWRIAAILTPTSTQGVPDGNAVVEAAYTASGKCLNGPSTWTADVGAGATVRLADLSVSSASVGVGPLITSQSCVTSDNPLGAVTALSPPTITRVQSAQSLLDGK